MKRRDPHFVALLKRKRGAHKSKIKVLPRKVKHKKIPEHG